MTTVSTQPITESTTFPRIEDSLDPQDWEAFRELSHQMLDRMLDYQRTVRQRVPWRQVPPEVERRLEEGPPREGLGLESAYQDFLDLVLPYPTGNIHPRFWGWVSGTGSPSGMMAEMLAAGLNSISGIFNDSAARVETQVVDWMREALDFPKGTSGVITSGGSVANLIGLAVARDTIAKCDVSAEGVAAESGKMVLYASREVHSSVLKAIQILGLGRRALRSIPVDADYRIQTADLAEVIRRDREEGLVPFAIVGNAGSVNTGAVDDLEALADSADREGLWFHIDGAFGALARLAPSLAHTVRGLERADSLAFDFHKWMYVPYEAGCVLIRDGERHEATFKVSASYLEVLPRGVAAQPTSTNLRSLQLSRGFKALKVWMLIKEHGLDLFGRLIERNVAQARYLADRIEAEAELELLAPVELNIVCFRFRPLGLGGDTLNEVNRELLMSLHELGVAVPSSTVLDGRFALRVAISNQRSRFEDFDLLVEQVLDIGARLIGGDR